MHVEQSNNRNICSPELRSKTQLHFNKKQVIKPNVSIKNNVEFRRLQAQLDGMDLMIVQDTYNQIKAEPILEQMTHKLFQFYESRNQSYKELLNSFISFPVVKEELSFELQTFLSNLIEAQRSDMNILIKELSSLKKRDNFHIQKLNNYIEELELQLQEIKQKDEKEELYRQLVIEKGGKTNHFKQLTSQLKEYEDIDFFIPEKTGKQRYSGVERDLDIIFSHLALFHGINFTDRRMLEIEDLLDALPKQSLLSMFAETASDVQKKTAFKVLEKIIENKKIPRE